MFRHVMVGARDLARMGALCDSALAPLGRRRRWEGQDTGGPPGIGWAAAVTSVPTFFVEEHFDRGTASAGNGCVTAFLAPSPDAARAAHAAGFAAGGRVEGAPGKRPRYGRGYHGAYLRDPEGNKLHVVHRCDLAG